MRGRSARLALAAAVATTAPLVTAPAALADDPGWAQHTVIADQLNNPRQLSLGPAGALFVAEAGRGSNQEIGFTSSITRIAHPDRVTGAAETNDRVVTGILSVADPDTGAFAVGLDGVSVLGNGQVFAVTTAAPPCALQGVPADIVAQAGKLWRFDTRGHGTVMADIATFEWASNPDNGVVDEPNDCQGPVGEAPDLNSNPYAVLALPGRTLVADAGGNTIYQVRPGRAGDQKNLSVFAVIGENGLQDGSQTVPTSLAAAPDGSIYVGSLLLGAFFGGGVGEARVWHYSADGELLDWIDGFNTITGLAVGPDGSLYVSQLFTSTLDKVDPSTGAVTQSWQVPFPAGVAVARDGSVYVSVWSVADFDGAPGNPSTGDPALEPGAVWRLASS